LLREYLFNKIINMKRKVQLTESQLVGLIKRAINEQNQGKIESKIGGGWCHMKAWDQGKSRFIEGPLIKCSDLGEDGEPLPHVLEKAKTGGKMIAAGTSLLYYDKYKENGMKPSENIANKVAELLKNAFTGPLKQGKSHKDNFIQYLGSKYGSIGGWEKRLGFFIQPETYPNIWKDLQTVLGENGIYLYTKNGPEGTEIHLSDSPTKNANKGSISKTSNVEFKSCTGTYKKGCKSETIKKVQNCLGLVADGKFGSKTEAKLKSVDPKFATSFTDKDVETICNFFHR